MTQLPFIIVSLYQLYLLFHVLLWSINLSSRLTLKYEFDYFFWGYILWEARAALTKITKSEKHGGG
jgi:hypothetical protein